MYTKTKYLGLALLPALLVACGGGEDGNVVPTNTHVAVVPDNIEWEVSELRDDDDSCIYGVWYQDEPIMISVRNDDGSVLSEVDLVISLTLSGNNYSGIPRLKLYEDRNGNGVVDDPEELVSGEFDPLFQTTTAQYSGDKLMFVRMDLACEYRGTLYAMVGGYMGQVNFSVNPKEDPAP